MWGLLVWQRLLEASHWWSHWSLIKSLVVPDLTTNNVTARALLRGHQVNFLEHVTGVTWHINTLSSQLRATHQKSQTTFKEA